MSDKSYIVLARKYRPQDFDSVIGQEAAVTTLKNAIEMGRVGHAYLFTGPRGVGKTSMARIFARALNCKNGPTIKPCGKCQSCLEIEGSRSLDVLEIDGASNRGIDEIRALRENVKFAPAAGKFKIYIIDEVHQITTDGFNALLKTLEEPPPHVKFIFATTSAHKVPATILSRCQKFDFRRIPTPTIAAHLKEIASEEKIKIDDEALALVAQAGDGSMRDSQSILDQIAASTGGKIKKDDVVRSLGMLDEEKLLELSEALAKEDAKAAILLLNRLLDEGKDPAIFMEKFLEHARNLLFVHVSEELLDLIEAGDGYKKALLKQKALFSKEDLFYFVTVVSQTILTMKRFESKRVPLEIALVKLSRRAPMESIADALESLKNLEKKTPERSVSTVRPTVKSAPIVTFTPPPAPTPAKVEISTEEESGDDVEELAGEEEIVVAPVEKGEISLESIWQPFLKAVKTEKMSAASYLAQGELRGFKNGVVSIGFSEENNFGKEYLQTDVNRKLLEKHLSVLLDQPTRVELETVKNLSGKSKESAESLVVQKDPEVENKVKSAMNIFGGRVIG